MQRVFIVVVSVVLVLGVATAAAAQAQGLVASQGTQAAAATPIPTGAVVTIYRCEVKPGQSLAQQKAAAATSRGIAKMRGGMNVLAMNAMTGPIEVWFLLPYNSLADIDGMNEAMGQAPALQAELDRLNDVEGSHYTSMRAMMALYREDLSIDASFNVAPYRGMVMTTYRVRPGRDAEFVDGAKKVLAAYRKAVPAFRIAGFQVLGGAPSGTFLFMRPIKTATELVPPDSLRKAYVEAMGGQPAIDQMEKAIGEVVASSEDTIFTFSPRMSAVPSSYEATDPFWRVTTPAVSKADMKNAEEAKKKAVEPTVKK